MDNRATGAWGELRTPEPELNYVRFMDSEICRLERAAAEKQRKAKNRRKWRKIENLLWKTAWTVGLIALGLAVMM